VETGIYLPLPFGICRGTVNRAPTNYSLPIIALYPLPAILRDTIHGIRDTNYTNGQFNKKKNFLVLVPF